MVGELMMSSRVEVGGTYIRRIGVKTLLSSMLSLFIVHSLGAGSVHSFRAALFHLILSRGVVVSCTFKTPLECYSYEEQVVRTMTCSRVFFHLRLVASTSKYDHGKGGSSPLGLTFSPSRP